MFDKQKLKEIKQGKENWEREIVSKSLEKLPEKGEISTSSNIPINRIYTPLDVIVLKPLNEAGVNLLEEKNLELSFQSYQLKIRL